MKDKKDSKSGMTTAQRIAIMKAEMNQMRASNKATGDAYKKYNRERTPISGEPSSGSTLGQRISKAAKDGQSISDRSKTLGRLQSQEARKKKGKK